ncbi:hypothetical protein LRS05_03110 [Flavobacterium sp. J372]|uniref:hypothetical protein n=1 Tax=Flavobacterium sp. J372 TaxID=2898436 RepID=UPI002151550A|nr:hypothetical protein [Flavobacterium sp. J372]MCR5861193.1 hypothetical protein [Flavobacterium sp. J372]
MDYQKILHVSEDRLRSKFPEIVDGIKDCIISGSTGGEIIFNVGGYLSDLKFNNPEAYVTIEKEISSYLKMCKENGIFFK